MSISLNARIFFKIIRFQAFRVEYGQAQEFYRRNGCIIPQSVFMLTEQYTTPDVSSRD